MATTVRLPDDLKAAVTKAATQAGTTAHNFMLQAIAEKTEAQQRQTELHALADARYADIVASGRAVPWAAMRDYLQERIRGAPARPVKPRKLVP